MGWGGCTWVALGETPPEPPPAHARRPGGSRTYPWVLLGMEALPPFPGLLQGRIQRRGAAQQRQQQPQQHGHGTQLGGTVRAQSGGTLG